MFDQPAIFYQKMLDDINLAEKYIYLETYKFGNDERGLQFRKAFTRKARQGIKVKLMVDSWGVSYTESFFEELISYGGEVRFFRKIKFTFDFFTKNHRRNHRKLLIIDDTISYIGSANITGYSHDWRESVLRLTGGISEAFKKSFLESFRIYNRYIFNKLSFKKIVHVGDFEIVQDNPSIYRQQIKNKLERLISKAKREILIETPYFLPGFRLRKTLAKAAGKGVNIKIILPQHSDVRAVDLLRNKYMGFYYKNNIHIVFYTPNNLHAKAVLIDDEVFGLGSPNIDYRSFRYQHEIMLFGKNKGIVNEVRNHFHVSLESCLEFDHVAWMRRPRFEKMLGWLLLPFRHLF
ncbi:MAG: phosphatidylserine/phosphatidylglycerophosphate/cardiolipin synthase family protein [Bacteroidetes bacterium]|nr:phosphatidylserine/phosphatidylglycerophosphate/cardiolipin synthase family protein [Bacteroidota bacterium]